MDWADLQLSLRNVLNEWDPIGVAEIAPDEYDCMHGPLFDRLRAGAGQTEIREFLRHELGDHFGLDPARYDLDSVANRIVGWWNTVQPAF
jgi:hypothetical protein